MPSASAQISTSHLFQLFGKKNLVEIVHLFVSLAVVIFKEGMFVYCPGWIKLETFYPLIKKTLEVIHPMFLARTLEPFSHCYCILFRETEIIFFTKPQAQMETHIVQFADEKSVIIFLRKFIGSPIWLWREQLIIPFFFS